MNDIAGTAAGAQPGTQFGVLSGRGFLGLFVLTTALIALAAAQVYRHYAGGIVSRAEAELLAIANTKRADIEKELRDRIADAALFSQRTATQNALLPMPATAERSMFAQLLPAVVETTRANYGYRRIVVLDREARQVYPAAGAAAAPAVIESVRAAIASRQPIVVDLHVVDRDGTREINFGVVHPVFARGEPRGPVLGATYIEQDAVTQLYPIVRTWPAAPSRTGESVLVRRDGNDVLFLSELRHERSAAPLSVRRPAGDRRQISARAMDAPTGIIHGAMNYRGELVLGAVAPVSNTPWLIVSMVAADEAEEELVGLARATVLLATVFAALVGSLVFLLWRSEKLGAAAREASMARQLMRLNEYYAFLLHANRVIAQLRGPEEILAAVCRAAVEEGGFLLAWAGIVREDADTVESVCAFGASADYVRTLTVTLDPALPTSHGPTGTAVREGRVVTANDFLDDPRTGSWHERARANGVRASAVVPVAVNGRTRATLNLYAPVPGYFDDEMVRLLAETARNVGLAWEAGEAARERDAERERRAASEARFERIFDASPAPIALRSLADGALLAINDAHQRLFGYRLEDIAGPDAWFEKAYPDPESRRRVRDNWQAHLIRARETGATVESPDLEVRCRDGGTRTARAYMSVSGNDIIVAWSDLTAIRKGEEALRESERRFRGMIDQAVTGIYVTQDLRIVYANPRMAEITGHAPEELLGRDPMDFVAPADLAAMQAERDRLASGEETSSYRMRIRRKDGELAVLAATAARSRWDGEPAMVVMLEDITARARVEERAAEYLRRLEASMRGTVQAVSRMVELRDPYTAGHERRVGIIAAAIAKEMGWARERCGNLDLVGLVHDIGKISVPAEILSKPTRLSKAEYDLVKGHAQAGYDILRDVEFDGMPVAEIVRQHHERLDGSGYPQGLKDEEILPEARVLAVADVVESMSSHRPYRPSLGLDAALAELEAGKGRLYDAGAVDALLRLVRDKGYVLPD